jgi:colicin import membrane protein
VKETRADTVQAFVAALLLHALLFALAFFGLWWTRSEASMNLKGPTIEAELVDPNALSAATRRALRSRPEEAPAPTPTPPEPQEATPPEQPQPEPIPQASPQPPQPVAQERIPEPDTRDQEAASKQSVAPKPPAEKEQEAKRRQEQIDLTERERQAEAERKQRLSQMERMRQEQLANLRKQREQQKKIMDSSSKNLAKIDARNANDAVATASPPPGNNGVDDNLTQQYYRAIAEAVKSNWTRPDNITAVQRCPVRIRQLPGGEVISAEVLPSCPYDELGRRSVEAAVLRAQPLPYAGFESVFKRELDLNVKPAD